MNEDQVHQARCDKERFFLVMETTAERSRHLWSVREKLREHCMAHWAVIGFSRPATLEQIYRPSVSGADFKAWRAKRRARRRSTPSQSDEL